MTFVADDYEKLTSHLFGDSSVEQAAYLLCGISETQAEIRFLVRSVVPVAPDKLKEQSEKHLAIPSSSFVPVLKQAAARQECFFLVHSHPKGFKDFSSQDDLEEPKLFRAAYIRIGFGLHGSLVFSGRDSLSGRVWIDDGGEFRPISLHWIRVIGRRFEFLIPENGSALHDVMPDRFFDRQIRAFGKDLQRLLGNLHVGVVGCGGTGSAVIEQLARLGVGQLTIVDDDKVEDTNISRVHGSTLHDEGREKVQVMQDMIQKIGFGTEIHVIKRKAIYESVARALRNCDLIFGCTDDQAGRMILNELSIHYYIPLIDMGVVIDSHSGYLRSVLGRVTMVRPRANCLLCRQWIRIDMVEAELMSAELRERRAREGYAPELEEKDPAVVSFTTAVAAQSVMEMLHLITGYMGDERDVRDILWRMDSTAYSFRPVPNSEGCSCTTPKKVGRGDRREFLGMLFMAEPECEV